MTLARRLHKLEALRGGGITVFLTEYDGADSVPCLARALLVTGRGACVSLSRGQGESQDRFRARVADHRARLQ